MVLKSQESYTKELQEVITYMVDTLVNEFPTDVFTTEYLILSILDTKNCRANAILDTFLTSSNFDGLKQIYTSTLEKHIKPNLKIDVTKEQVFKFDFTLNKIFDCAKEEMQKTNSSEIGTEHIILAILNPSNKIEARKVFKEMGLNYAFLLKKCTTIQTEEKHKPLTSNLPNEQMDILPLKSEINPKAVMTKGDYISQYTININELIREKKTDKIVNRDDEIKQIIRTMARRKKNNAILVGEGGVGKTSLVYLLAKMIETGEVPPVLEEKQVLMLDTAGLISGTQLRGMYEERVNGLLRELKTSSNNILFIDDIHTVLKGTSKDKDSDLSSMLNEVLTDGTVRVLATTSNKEYRNTIESNSQIQRKFQKINIEPTTKEQTLEILKNIKSQYEEHHHVVYTDEALSRTVELATRYITTRCLPDSAIDIIDLAGANTCLQTQEPEEIANGKKRLREIQELKNQALNSGNFEEIDGLNNEENSIKLLIADFKRETRRAGVDIVEIGGDNVAATVSEMTGIPVSKLNAGEKKKIAHIDDVLKKEIIGQDEAIDDVCKAIKRQRVGLGNPGHPISTLLFLGPSGVGKSLLAKKLAEEIFGDEKALVRIDMSEYSEKNSVSKLTGAAPGYIGYDNGGQLTEAIKRKQHCVLLLDEIEKADQEVYNVFLQLFDEGRLTDSSGQLVNFKNVLIIMTSNIGVKQAAELGAGVGFNTNEAVNKKSIIEKQLKKTFTPEFLNRIDKIVYFNSLNDDNLKEIVTLEMEKLNKRLGNINYNIEYKDDTVKYIHAKAVKEKDFGARPIARLVQNEIEDKITDLLLENDYEPQHTFKTVCSGDTLIVD